MSPALSSSGHPGVNAAAAAVVLAGVSAALHMAKLFPALPVLRESFGISWVQAGFLLSAVQLAGMTLGLAAGLLADGFGLKRCMLAGLGVLAGAGALAGWMQTATQLLALRALEGIGFLLVCTPAPALIRQLVAPSRLGAVLGIWSAYMPFATALALLLGPALILLAGWQVWWWILSALSLGMAAWLWRVVPSDAALKATAKAVSASVPERVAGQGQPSVGGTAGTAWSHRLSQTLSHRGPWLVALTFAAYSGQWVAVIGFLPSIYAQAGFAVGATAWLTALAAAVNIVGNVASGRLLSRGVRPQTLLYTGFCVMGVAAFVAFTSFGAATTATFTAAATTSTTSTAATTASAAAPAMSAASDGAGLLAMVRYIAVLLFSMVGGVIPGTLFTLAVRLAPGHDTVSTTVGWMQQWSAFGQFAGPPLVAWVASSVGGWQWTWGVTTGCAAVGVLLARQLGRQLEPLHHAKTA